MKAALAKAARQSLERDCQQAMRQYLQKADESSLASAYELGRAALEQGMGVVEFAALHGQILANLLQSAHSQAECASTVRRLRDFFMESLSPFEMTHRGYRDAQIALRRVNETLEAEVKRIAHALHDEAGQLLVTVYFALEDLARKIPPGFEPQLEEVRHRLSEVEKELRRLSHELRPPMLDELGLIPALEFIAEGASKRSGISVIVQGGILERLPPRAEIALYRSVQEALTNIIKHAKARRVTISLRQEQQDKLNTVVCSVRDDGIGLEADATPGLGLLGMRERIHALGGALEINSAAGAGAELLFIVPLPDSPSV